MLISYFGLVDFVQFLLLVGKISHGEQGFPCWLVASGRAIGKGHSLIPPALAVGLPVLAGDWFHCVDSVGSHWWIVVY
jgi:hypothetical protein